MADSLRALILEDCEADALLLARHLKRDGFDLDYAVVDDLASFEAALGRTWDVVLSDYAMPQFTGVDAFKRMIELDHDIPFVIISGTIGEELAVAAMKVGVQDYLMKSELARLGEAIRREVRDTAVRRARAKAEAHADHLNRVLEAIRQIHRAIVRERAPDRLLGTCCDQLVGTRGYLTAWAALSHESHWRGVVVQRGFGDEFEVLRTRLETGAPAACCLEVLRVGRAVVLREPLPECAGCCALCDHHQKHETIAAPLRCNGKIHGFLCVSVPTKLGAGEDERLILEDVSCDLAFALTAIESGEALLRAEGALARRLRIERAVAQISARFVVEESFDAAVHRSLADIGEVTGAHRAYLFQIDDGDSFMDNTHEWCAAGVPPQIGNLQRLPTDAFPWWIAQLRADRIISIPDVGDMPAEARTEQAVLEGQEIRSLIVLPVSLRGRLRGFIGLDDVQGTREWGTDDTEVLRIAAQVMGGAIERWASRKHLESSEQRFRDLYHNAPNAYFSVRTRDGVIIDCNRTAGELLREPVEDIQGKRLSDYDSVAAGDEAHEDLFRRLTRGELVRGEELRIRRVDGSTIDVSLSVEPKFDEQGKVVESRSMVVDITERKRLQAQVAQSDRLASMGMLAAGVAHEINNPLSYVLYNLESLASDMPHVAAAIRTCLEERFTQDPAQSAFVEEGVLLSPAMVDDLGARFNDALQGAQRLKEIARGLRTFSRVDEERLVAVTLVEVIEVAINMAFNEIKYRARLVKDYGRTATLLANDGRLSQVFLNLLINAAHAIPEGDVEGNEIRVRTWQDADQVFAEVSDTGRGIPEKHLPHLFEPFFTTKELGAGTGLGLSISQSIVEGYGGRIEVRSTPGRGTCFTVRLPVRRPGEKPAKASVPADDGTSATVRGRVLVVDDEAAIRSILERMLSREHEVTVASSGEEGKQILSAHTDFDLILCDMMMPCMSGMDLHEWLTQAHPELARRVVFITGGTFTPKAKAYLQRVDNVRVEKPFDAANLISVVRELVQASRSRGES